MANYINLLGAESVQSAGHAIARAASDMQQAAGSIDSSLHSFKMFMEDWLVRFQQTLEKHKGVE